jgi:phosphoribosylglycinamide formyltransferase-1
MPFVILASGAGSNARALLELARERPGELRAVGVICDREAPARAVAEEFGVPSFVVLAGDEAGLLDRLRSLAPHWACLAGYRRLLGEGFLDFFRDDELGFSRVMNVHPSLLPAYPGLHGYRRAFRDGVKVSGVTVHLVDSGLDTGRAILQAAFPREAGDDEAAFEARGRALERQLFPRALALAAAGKLRLREVQGAEFVSTEG